MHASIRLVVTVTVEGNYYADPDDLARHVTAWIEDGLSSRDDIDTIDGLKIERTDCPQP